VNHHEYIENRRHFPPEELAKFDGKWVAFTLDGCQIIASSEDLALLDGLVISAGLDPEKVALERIALDGILETNGFF